MMPPVKECIWGVAGRNKTTCRGDSGGAMVIEDNGEFLQIGITSFGHKNCSVKPAVFTRVASYLNFIDDVTTKMPLSMSNV